MGRGFTATLSQSQNRSGWSIIFRHPVLIDPTTEKPGRRVRRGLGTSDEVAATELKRQLNQLLADERFWSPAARTEAAHRGIAPLVLDIFYDKLSADNRDQFTLRDDLLPVPMVRGHPIKRVLFLGTTGAGKTTLLRQLIGTTPDERFPSTSKAKTTIHDVEIIVQPGDYRAAVTFSTYDEIEEYVKENVVRATFEARRSVSDEMLLRRILVHVNERMRFNYVLGEGADDSPNEEIDGDEGIDDVEQRSREARELVDDIPSLMTDLARTNAILGRAVETVKALTLDLSPRAAASARGAQASDAQLVAQVEDEQFEALVREDERFHEAVDSLMDEIQQRFAYLATGDFQRVSAWPQSWTFASSDRPTFLRALRRFSSNHSELFGQLLTPLVNGMRVAGPFTTTWNPADLMPLLLMDGEGLGHSPRSAAAVSSTVMRRVAIADHVVLVDNAEQPMQAAPAAALRELIASGNLTKLVIAFTHMDEMDADNLRNARAQREHVLASAEGLAANLRESFGALAEESLRQRLQDACFFLSSIHERLAPESNRRHIAAVADLRRLIAHLGRDVERLPLGPSLPNYSVLALGFAGRRAAEEYTSGWGGRLGATTSSGGNTREPWQRVKALARRLATPGMGDEYDTLRPVSDFRRSLVEGLYPWIHAPLSWSGTEPAPATKQGIFDAFADEIAGRLSSIATRRVHQERARSWQDAYGLRGRFSTFSRSKIIHDDIVRQAAPNPDVALSPNASAFLDELVSAVREAAESLGIELRSA